MEYSSYPFKPIPEATRLEIMAAINNSPDMTDEEWAAQFERDE